MKGIYVLWSPKKMGFLTEDFNMIVLILSMIHWRKNGNTVKLYVDASYDNFLKDIGFYDLNLVDELDTKTLKDPMRNEINTGVHWSWANIMSIKNEKDPVAFIDWDLIFRPPFHPQTGLDLYYAHREKISFPIYPHPQTYIRDFKNSLFGEMDWDLEYAFNASFLYFGSRDLKEEYTVAALDYIKNPYNQKKHYYDYLDVRISFVDQYLLSSISQNFNTEYLIKDIFFPVSDMPAGWGSEDLIGHIKKSTGENLYQRNTDIYHTWHNKFHLKNYATDYLKHMKWTISELGEYGPEYLEKTKKILWKLSGWKKYAKEYNFWDPEPMDSIADE